MISLYQVFTSCSSCMRSMNNINNEAGNVAHNMTISPLFHCAHCSNARSKALQCGHIDAMLSNLRRDLLPETRRWVQGNRREIRESTEGLSLSFATIVIAQILVLASKEASLPRVTERLVDFAFGAFRHSHTLVHDGKASVSGIRACTVLAGAIASWICILPLVVANVSKIKLLVERAAKQALEQKIKTSVDNELGSVIMSLLSSHANIAYVSTNKDANSSSMDQILEWHRREEVRVASSCESESNVSNRSSRENFLKSCSKDSGQVVIKEDGYFPLLQLDEDSLSVVLSMLSPQRVLWGAGLACRQLGEFCRDPLLWKLFFRSRWPNIQCVGHSIDDDHDWLRLYINRRVLARLANEKRKHQLRWMRRNKNGNKRVGPFHIMCNVCGCTNKLHKETLMSNHMRRKHRSLVSSQCNDNANKLFLEHVHGFTNERHALKRRRLLES